MTATFQAPPELSMAERYEALIRVSQSISAHRDPEDLFRQLGAELRQVAQFDGIAVVQCNETANGILRRVLELPGQPGAVLPPDLFPSEIVSEWVCGHKQPLVFHPAEESRFPQLVEFLRRQGLQSICALPLPRFPRVIIQ